MKKQLTEKQAEIVVLIVQGLTVVEIADQLQYNHRTVEGHIYRMKKTWGAKTLAHLVSILIFNKVIVLK